MECWAAKFRARSRSRAATAITSAPKVSFAGVMMPRGAIRAAPRMPMRIMGAESRMRRQPAAHCGRRRCDQEPALTRVALIGATGRMGTAIVRAGVADQTASVVAAVASAGSKSAGRDVGEVAGIAPLGVRVLDALPADLAGAQVVIDFSRPDLSLR